MHVYDTFVTYSVRWKAQNQKYGNESIQDEWTEEIEGNYSIQLKKSGYRHHDMFLKWLRRYRFLSNITSISLFHLGLEIVYRCQLTTEWKKLLHHFVEIACALFPSCLDTHSIKRIISSYNTLALHLSLFLSLTLPHLSPLPLSLSLPRTLIVVHSISSSIAFALYGCVIHKPLPSIASQMRKEDKFQASAICMMRKVFRLNYNIKTYFGIDRRIKRIEVRLSQHPQDSQ